MLTNFELFFWNLKLHRVKLLFYKHLPPGFQNWTFLKCPFSKTSSDSFSVFYNFFMKNIIVSNLYLYKKI